MINIATFGTYLGGSLRVHGELSGQEFREDVLTPALRDALRARRTVIVRVQTDRNFFASSISMCGQTSFVIAKSRSAYSIARLSARSLVEDHF